MAAIANIAQLNKEVTMHPYYKAEDVPIGKPYLIYTSAANAAVGFVRYRSSNGDLDVEIREGTLKIKSLNQRDEFTLRPGMSIRYPFTGFTFQAGVKVREEVANG
jgi:hypothetical protein